MKSQVPYRKTLSSFVFNQRPNQECHWCYNTFILFSASKTRLTLETAHSAVHNQAAKNAS